MTLGHEIAGHAFHKHSGKDYKYNCVTINVDFVDTSNINESVSDIAASVIYKDAQAAGLTSSADAPTEEAALRALGNLYIASNLATYSKTADMNSHVTTLLFDPKSENFKSDIDIANMPSASTLPLTINRIADAISGFIFVQDVKKLMAETPEKYSPEQHTYFNALSTDPKDFANYINEFATQGQNIRFGITPNNISDGLKPDPQHHYAAVAFIKKHDLLSPALEDMAPEYAIATNDLINDFLEAADKYAPKLKNPEISARLEKELKPEHFNFLTFNVLTNSEPEKQTEPEAEEPNAPQI